MAAAIVMTVIFSYRSYGSPRETSGATLQLLRSLQDRISSIDGQVQSLNQQLALVKERMESSSGAVDFQTGRNGPGENGGLLTAAVPEDLTHLKQMVKATESEQLRLGKIIAATGLDQLAGIENIDPDILKEIYDDRAGRRTFDSRRDLLQEQNRQLHLADQQRYDQGLDQLYQRARFRMGRGAINPDSDQAFNEMREKYPDAYATAMVTAERALFYARRNTEEAEKYYTMLRGSKNESYANIITDRGIEAMPNIEFNLMRRYVRDGRVEDATFLAESLKTNYPDSLLPMGRGPAGVRWQTVSQAISGLRSGTN
ncbi:MAG: hypothetical protein Q8P24_04715 [Desulfobacterales bacterium]|nr:hypothetical protein [Desulfobacterales bacterium]